MNKNLQKLIKEEFSHSLNERKTYNRTRCMVEQMVRETLLKKIDEGTKFSKVQLVLSNPTVNKSALARKINGLSDDDDTRRSEISKIARGEWEPSIAIQNDILHMLTTYN